jgi:hypothetical protein
MLSSAVRHYADTCGQDYGVAQVFIIWAELNVEPPEPNHFFQRQDDDLHATAKVKHESSDTNSKRAAVSILRVPKDSLNSRFLPIPNLQSNGIFMVDDDIRVACSDLQRAFQAWTFHPHSMTGFYPRLSSPPLFKTISDQFIYHTWPILYLHSSFNMILTKAGFLHKNYLTLYSDETQHPKDILQYVDDHKNCEDIAMAFLVANRTRMAAQGELVSLNNQKGYSHLRDPNPPRSSSYYCSNCPVYVQGDVSDLGLFNGLSTKSKGGLHKITGHIHKRNDCLDSFTRIYRDHGWEYPLFDVPLVKYSWIHHFPGFWWQQQPSNFFEWLSFGNTLK